jgi:hypothetical protein
MKDCLFQFYVNDKCIEDTSLISKEEAHLLYDKYFSEIQDKYMDDKFELCIWGNCKYDFDYHTEEKYINDKILKDIT